LNPQPKGDIGDWLVICHPATILRSVATPIKPNPPNDGYEKYGLSLLRGFTEDSPRHPES